METNRPLKEGNIGEKPLSTASNDDTSINSNNRQNENNIHMDTYFSDEKVQIRDSVSLETNIK